MSASWRNRWLPGLGPRSTVYPMQCVQRGHHWFSVCVWFAKPMPSSCEVMGASCPRCCCFPGSCALHVWSLSSHSVLPWILTYWSNASGVCKVEEIGGNSHFRTVQSVVKTKGKSLGLVLREGLQWGKISALSQTNLGINLTLFRCNIILTDKGKCCAKLVSCRGKRLFMNWNQES